ncbi:helix-turn-helix transcriptional regulator [Natrinema marinum]|uniref:helix-turn-helix transcriptional regulator n=1 Tax=Natrinema marinum TaxID=2961598 RepID=UPI0020C8DB81|nr:hypothetical protein [Natrinema marinum]
MDGDGLVELLQLRHDVLDELADEQYSRHELIDVLPDSKSTIYKGLSQLQESGLVERTEDGLKLTLLGVVALARYRTLADTADTGDLLAEFPGSSVDPKALVGADVVRPDESDVERHLEAFWELLDDADHITGITPVVSPGYIDRFRSFLDGGLTADLVLPEEVLKSFQSTHPNELSTLSDRVVLSKTTTEIPFGILVTEGSYPRMAIELRDGPLITGLVVNDTPDAIEWARETIDRFRANATQVGSSSTEPGGNS